MLQDKDGAEIARNGMGARNILFTSCLLTRSFSEVGTALGLIIGILFSLPIANPWPCISAKLSKIILQISVVGLGFGLRSDKF
jgi:hypothetical protein